MRLNAPRIPPLEPDEWNAEQADLMAPLVARDATYNVFKTLLRDPAAFRAFMAWGNYVLGRDLGLAQREREIAVLRTGWHGRAGYEWAQHEAIGRRVGLSGAEVQAIKAGPGDPIWGAADRAILQACDELSADRFVTDATWAELGEHFDDKAKAAIVFTVGQYTQVCMILNSFGVQLDPFLTLDPDLDGRP